MERCGGVRRAPQKTRVKDEVKQTRVQNSDKMVSYTGKNEKQIRHAFRIQTKWSTALVKIRRSKTHVQNSDKMV
jgi:hypothetical protein